MAHLAIEAPGAADGWLHHGDVGKTHREMDKTIGKPIGKWWFYVIYYGLDMV